MRFRRALFVPILVLAGSAVPLQAQQIRGRAVDEPSRRGVRDLMVTVLAEDSVVVQTVTTDTAGFFRARTGSGRFTLIVEGIGYTSQRREISVDGEDVTIPAFVLHVDVVELDSLEATGRRRPAVAPVGFARAAHLLSADKLAQLDRRGTTLLAAVRHFNGLHIRQFRDNSGHSRSCVEARRAIKPMQPDTVLTRNRVRRTMQQSPCEWIVIVVDGLVTSDPEEVFRTQQNLSDYESIEFASPVDAGGRYGIEASSRGALVLWSRGRGPHVDPARIVR
jgi:hypothetical protein